MNKHEKKLEEHRVIGIRHALKAFKEDGLLDDDTYYPDDAVNEIKDDMLRLARQWYKIGARRGALVMLEALERGDIEIAKTINGAIETVAKKTELSWSRSLNVTVGTEKKQVSIRTYKLRMKNDLGFE
jgi:hypothetical protein